MKTPTHYLALAALLSVVAIAKADPLPQCDLAGTTGVRDFTANPNLESLLSYYRKLENVAARPAGQPVAKGEPVLVADVELFERFVSLIPSERFKYSSNLLAIAFRYDPSVPQEVFQKFKARNGETYHVLQYRQDAVFVREDGVPCGRVARLSRDASSVVAYTYQTEPEGGRFAIEQTERRKGFAGVRVIYMGTHAGTMQFQEVWTREGRILSSEARQCDQFAKNVQIAGFQFAVEQASPESEVIMVDAPPEAPVARKDLTELASQFLERR